MEKVITLVNEDDAAHYGGKILLIQLTDNLKKEQICERL